MIADLHVPFADADLLGGHAELRAEHLHAKALRVDLEGQARCGIDLDLQATFGQRQDGLRLIELQPGAGLGVDAGVRELECLGLGHVDPGSFGGHVRGCGFARFNPRRRTILARDVRAGLTRGRPEPQREPRGGRAGGDPAQHPSAGRPLGRRERSFLGARQGARERALARRLREHGRSAREQRARAPRCGQISATVFALLEVLLEPQTRGLAQLLAVPSHRVRDFLAATSQHAPPLRILRANDVLRDLCASGRATFGAPTSHVTSWSRGLRPSARPPLPCCGPRSGTG